MMNGKFMAHERRLLHKLDDLRKRRVQLRMYLRDVTRKMKVEYDKLPVSVKKKLSASMLP